MTTDVRTKIASTSRVAQRHAHLVNVAADLLLRQGFHQTSVREIAAAAGWQMATLYRYIARKEDVLYLISQAAMDDVWGGLQVLNPQGSARERLEQAARHFFQAVSRRRREFKLLYRESASLGEDHLRLIEGTELQERDYFAAIIADGIRSGEFAEVDVPVIAHDIIMLAHMWALKGWALRGDKDLDAYMETQLRVIFCALEPQRVDAEPKL